ncbi:MAG TPA: hypothetical protein VN894_02025 [Polyangiaceae bacterium]|nr:hypothetical protein [Polyangiaceae bacterium]
MPYLGPAPVTVYAAMFGAFVAGQLLGMSVDALVLGRRVVWVPLGCSVVLEALVGARFGASRIGHRVRWGEWGQVSAYYSGCLVALTLPLAAWTVAYNRRLAAAGSSREVAMALAVVLAAVVGATVLRHALMALFASRGPA